MMSAQWSSYPDANAAAHACSQQILALLETALSGGGQATLAMSGGSTPKLLFAHLVKAKFDWSHVHLFWVDERAVPPTDAQSNYKLAEENLITPAHVPHRNLHRIPAELGPEKAARRYGQDIMEFFELPDGELPHFDVVQFGMGPDAHTASLFPGEPLIDNREGIAAAVFVEKIPQWRITLLPGVLLAARHSVFLVAGEDKAEAVKTVFKEPYDPKRFPAQVISHHGRKVTWFLDQAAARFLE
jgi:6-phosphogluconolactonase